MERKKIMLAIDGGGTKTEFLLFEESGRVLSRAVMGGTNPNSVGMPNTLRVLGDGIEQLRIRAPQLRYVHAGIAGCSNPAHQSAVGAFVRERFAQLEFSIASDTLNLIGSAQCDGDCIAAICGTGSVVFAKNGLGLHRLGGWGYRFSTGGSGYDIGRDAVQAVLAQYEQTGPKTALAPLLEDKVGGDLWENIDRLYTMPPEKIASFAPDVLRAWEAGDDIAACILNKNMDALAVLINAAAERFGGETLVLSGGLTAREDMLKTFLYPKLPQGLKVVVPRLPQAFGACLLCAQKAGGPAKGFAEEFEKSYFSVREEDGAC